MRSSSDIYYAATRSSIAVEPEADPEKRLVLRFLGDYLEVLHEEWIVPALQKNESLRGISAEKKRAALEYLVNAQQIDVGGASKRIVYDEYQAFSERSGQRGSDLWVEPLDPGSRMRTRGIDLVSAVKNLREVRAIVGFNRGGQAPDPAFDVVPGDAAPVAISKYRMALGYENRGEGIFLRFDSSRLASG